MADSRAPLGHSVSAHRVHGWCSHCRGHGPGEEIVAWRLEAADRLDAADRLAVESEDAPVPGERPVAERDDQVGPVVDFAPMATATHDLRCQGCGQDTLIVVTVSAVVLDVNRKIGGWAICLGCGACPHPVMEVPGG